MKTNPKILQKQHGYKPHYILKKHQYILKVNQVSKTSMSYEFKPNNNHNHSVPNP